MKKPEEIKQALNQCSYGNCKYCPYTRDGCVDALLVDALEYIKRLEQELADRKRFKILRQKTFEGIKKAISIDGHYKSYEGVFEVIQRYPSYFEDEQACVEPETNITLRCYVLGPSRHYEWAGKTFSEAMDKAERDIDEWIREIDTEEDCNG